MSFFREFLHLPVFVRRFKADSRHAKPLVSGVPHQSIKLRVIYTCASSRNPFKICDLHYILIASAADLYQPDLVAAVSRIKSRCAFLQIQVNSPEPFSVSEHRAGVLYRIPRCCHPVQPRSKRLPIHIPGYAALFNIFRLQFFQNCHHFTCEVSPMIIRFFHDEICQRRAVDKPAFIFACFSAATQYLFRI